jgi:hypothetical protein
MVGIAPAHVTQARRHFHFHNGVSPRFVSPCARQCLQQSGYPFFALEQVAARRTVTAVIGMSTKRLCA